ncbi:MAG: hypothetical protein JO127_18580 [Caulobacteraceae bacterium]|nr:hypothetical protein [Caulobacteraceae bacterium]
MKRWMPVGAALLLASGVWSAAAAQGAAGASGGVRSACQAELDKLCPDAAAQGRGAFQCLRQHEDALPDACKSAMAIARANHHAHGGWSGPGETPTPQN